MNPQIYAGDTLNFVRAVPGYLASAGWVLKYRLVPRAAGSPIDITATAEGDSFRILQPSSTTANWTAGEYSWVAWVEKGAEDYTIDQGQTTILPDLRSLSSADNRSAARKALDSAKAAFATFTATNGAQRKYRIGEREMEFRSTAEIIQQIHYWEGEVAREEQADRRRKGLRPKNRTLVRFTRPR